MTKKPEESTQSVNAGTTVLVAPAPAPSTPYYAPGQIVFAARDTCLCSERAASIDGGKTWKCARILQNNKPTKNCQTWKPGTKIYAEGDPELAEKIRARMEKMAAEGRSKD